MAIFIPHRFIKRLTSTRNLVKVNVIIIGTFNPGLPDLTLLTAEERSEFDEICATKKFKKFNEVRNFYDRPQNRFWKIMDHVQNQDFYTSNSFKTINPNGLKYYLRMGDRDGVFERQKVFCDSRGILVTDIVQAIRPVNFVKIYDNFPDAAVERANPIWNDQEILSIIQEHQPRRVIVNFNPEASNIPKIAAKMAEIKAALPKESLITLPSTSGAAGGTYENLIQAWRPHL